LEAGGFNPLLGRSFTEIAAASLSMHKSQGVGSPPRRGARKEYFKLLEGAPMGEALFDGIDTSWARVPKSETIAAKVKQLLADFSPADPAASVPKLIELRKELAKDEKNDWFLTKTAEVDALIVACLALHIESSTASAVVSPGQALPIKLEAINRSKVPVQLVEARAPVSGEQLRLDTPLPQDEFVAKDLSPTLPRDVETTQPYWLRKPAALGTFVVDNQKLVGLPENPLPFPIEVLLRVGDQDLRYLVDTKYRTVDRVIGEIR